MLGSECPPRIRPSEWSEEEDPLQKEDVASLKFHLQMILLLYDEQVLVGSAQKCLHGAEPMFCFSLVTGTETWSKTSVTWGRYMGISSRLYLLIYVIVHIVNGDKRASKLIRTKSDGHQQYSLWRQQTGSLTAIRLGWNHLGLTSTTVPLPQTCIYWLWSTRWQTNTEHISNSVFKVWMQQTITL